MSDRIRLSISADAYYEIRDALRGEAFRDKYRDRLVHRNGAHLPYPIIPADVRMDGVTLEYAPTQTGYAQQRVALQETIRVLTDVLRPIVEFFGTGLDMGYYDAQAPENVALRVLDEDAVLATVTVADLLAARRALEEIDTLEEERAPIPVARPEWLPPILRKERA